MSAAESVVILVVCLAAMVVLAVRNGWRRHDGDC